MEWIYSNKITTLRSTVIDGKLGVFFGQRLVSNPEVSQHLVSFVGSYLSISSSISSFIYIYLVLCGFHQASIFIDISQLHTILSKWPAAMIREDLVCHDKVTCVTFVIVLIFWFIWVASTHKQLLPFPYLHMFLLIFTYATMDDISIPWIAQLCLVSKHMFV